MEKRKKIRLLFLCTANACRSQMAEGWANHLKSDVIEAFSAGVRPYKVNERAIQVMAEAGVDISTHYSKHVDEMLCLDFDYVVTVCDNAREICPVFPNKVKTVHVSFEDPDAKIGTIDEIMDTFRKVRDQIKEFVETMPESLTENQ